MSERTVTVLVHIQAEIFRETFGTESLQYILEEDEEDFASTNLNELNVLYHYSTFPSFVKKLC